MRGGENGLPLKGAHCRPEGQCPFSPPNRDRGINQLGSLELRLELLEALVARRCYATSGAKIWLDVVADGVPMGSALDDRESAEFQVDVCGSDTLQRIELVGAAGVLAHSEPHSRKAQLRARVASPFVYARVTQVDGEMAWSSPVFLGAKREAPPEP